MATLILRSSCTPLNGRSNAATTGRDANANGVPDAHAMLGNHAAGSRGFEPWTTTASSSSGGMNSVPAMMMGPAGIHSKNANVNGVAAARSNQQDLEFLDSLPLQCDVMLIPRIPIHEHYDSSFSEHVTTNDPTYSFSSTNQQQQQHRHLLRTLRIPRQSFFPCGMNNVITIDQLPVATTQGVGGGGGGGGAYLLSLTHCVVNINDSDGDASSVTTLPVAAMPSTFQFSFHGDENDSSILGDDMAHEYVGGGGVHRIGEIHVSFDFSNAVELYQESVRKSRVEKEEATCKSTDDHGATSNVTSASSWNSTKSSSHGTNKSEVASIMLSLEEESRFIKRTLTALGCMSIVFVTAFVWTLWKMTSKGRRSRRRILVVNDAWRHAVPREIVDVKSRSISTLAGDEKKEDGSIQSGLRGGSQLIPNISPLRTSSVVNAELDSDDDDMQRPRGIEHGNASRGTLNLVSPFTPPFQAEGAAAKQQQCGAAAAADEPRHWYEDFLSPPSIVKQFHKRSSSDSNFSLFAAKKDISRSLFSPLKSSPKTDSTLENEDDVPLPEVGVDGANISVVEDVTQKKSGRPRELNFDTPIARSALSPPPSCVNVLQLTNHILSSLSFDDGSEVTSQKSIIDLSPAQAVEPQAKVEPSVEEDGSHVLPGIYDEAQFDSYSDVTSPIDIARDQDSPISSDEPTLSYNGTDPSTANVSEQEENDVDASSMSEDSMIEIDADPMDISGDMSSLSSASDEVLKTWSLEAEASSETPLSVVSDGIAGGCSDDSEVNIVASPALERASASHEVVVRCHESIVDEEETESIYSRQESAEASIRAPSIDEDLEEESTVDTHFSAGSNGIADCGSEVTIEVDVSPERLSLHAIPQQERKLAQLETSCDDAKDEETESGRKLISPPKITTKAERSRFGFKEELVERATGTKAPSPSASINDFGDMLAQRAFDTKVGKFGQTVQSKPVAKVDDFASSLAKKAAYLSVGSAAKTPKRKTLTPLGQSLRSTPASTHTGTSSDKFLSDYW